MSCNNVLLHANNSTLTVMTRGGVIKSVQCSKRHENHFNEYAGLTVSLEDSAQIHEFHMKTFLTKVLELGKGDVDEWMDKFQKDGVPEEFENDLMNLQEACRVPFSSMSCLSPSSYCEFMIAICYKTFGGDIFSSVPKDKIETLAEELEVRGNSFLLHPKSSCHETVTEYDLKSTYPSLVWALALGADIGFDMLMKRICDVRDECSHPLGKLLCKRIMLVTIGFISGHLKISSWLNGLRSELSKIQFYTNVLMRFIVKSLRMRGESIFYGVVDSVFVVGDEVPENLDVLNGLCNEFLEDVGSLRPGSLMFKREVHGLMRFMSLHHYTLDGEGRPIVKGLVRKGLLWTPEDELYIVNRHAKRDCSPPESFTEVKEETVAKFLVSYAEKRMTHEPDIITSSCNEIEILKAIVKAIRKGTPAKDSVGKIIAFREESIKVMRMFESLIDALNEKGM